MFHIALHLIVPLLIASLFFKSNVLRSFLIMMATMAVDLDHLLATPIYDSLRCSIGFHPLHSLPLIALYAGLCFAPKFRLIGIGLMIHMALDALDCVV